MVSGLKLPENEPKTPFEKWLKQRYPVLPPNFTIADMEAAWLYGEQNGLEEIQKPGRKKA